MWRQSLLYLMTLKAHSHHHTLMFKAGVSHLGADEGTAGGV